MTAELPPYLLTEEEYSAWCAARGLDETDLTWRAYVAWIEGEYE